LKYEICALKEENSTYTNILTKEIKISDQQKNENIITI